MLITINNFKYRARDVASYSANSSLQRIQRIYFLKYAPSGYFNPDGTVALINSPDEVEFNGKDGDEGKYIPKKIVRKLTDEEIARMWERMENDPDYADELLDFHCIPMSGSPLLSNLLVDYKPNEEEEELEIVKARNFFYNNGILSNPKNEESSETTQEFQEEKENLTTQENS